MVAAEMTMTTAPVPHLAFVFIALYPSLLAAELVDDDSTQCRPVSADSQGDKSPGRFGRSLLAWQANQMVSVKQALPSDFHVHRDQLHDRRGGPREHQANLDDALRQAHLELRPLPIWHRELQHNETTQKIHALHDVYHRVLHRTGYELTASTRLTKQRDGMHEETVNDERPFSRRTKTRIPRGKQKVFRDAIPHAYAVDADSQNVNLSCGASYFAPGPYRCPQECPYSFQDTAKGCHFVCAADCNESKSGDIIVVDEDTLACGSCKIMFCKTYDAVGGSCKECDEGFVLIDRVCTTRTPLYVTCIIMIMGIIIALVAGKFLYSVFMHPVVNKEVRDEAVLRRWRVCLRDKCRDGQPWFPLSTNLRAVPDGEPCVGGNGTMLYFNFLAAIICWIVFVSICWSVFASILGKEMLTVGTIYVDSDQELCQVIRWGSSIIDKFFPRVITFVFLLYICSFGGCLLLARRQRHLFLSAQAKSPNMSNYCINLTGFPEESADSVESDIINFITQAVGSQPVGVSIAWNFWDKEGEVRSMIADIMTAQEEVIARRVGIEFDGREPFVAVQNSSYSSSNVVRSASMALDNFVFWAAGCAENTTDNDQLRNSRANQFAEQVRQLVRNIPSSGIAYVVFSTKDERDRAFGIFSSNEAPRYRDVHKLKPRIPDEQPHGICWENLGRPHHWEVLRSIVGLFAMLLLSVIFAFGLIAPFSFYEINTFAKRGKTSSLVFKIISGVMITVQNRTIHSAGIRISAWIGYCRKSQEDRYCFFIYSFFLFANFLVDMFLVGYENYSAMLSTNTRLDDGKLIKDLPDLESIMLSYPMSRELGRAIFEFNVFGSFIGPVIFEVFFLELPYYIAYILLGTDRFSIEEAEARLRPPSFTLTRYYDVVLNLLQLAIAFFCASGWWLYNCVGLLAGCVCMYGFDHYRVLRHSVHFDIPHDTTDEIAHRLVSLPCGLIAASCIYLLSRNGVISDLQYFPPLLLMTIVLVSHVVLHLLLLQQWKPKQKDYSEERARHDAKTYAEAAARTPYNWFNSNPVQCLRSKYIYMHSPPCSFHQLGKEYILERNPNIGLYYDGMRVARTTDYEAKIASKPKMAAG
eukprot:TRINITY_DN20640_c0_g1_i1.p1 TRINITY_DN20640_c0_g1~~TRINITY_DN20640_c0_g1_i1.p1  ORF type:complete len:1093 (-),score=115.13 TRINITY_DN20640_c0_g1_i1:145-3423(-)